MDIVAQQNIWLDVEQRVRGVPDIVVRIDGRPALVLDTKYKLYQTKPSNDDFNQMVMYCHRLGLSRGLIVYPGGVKPDRFFFKDIAIQVRSLNLTGDLAAFRARCQAFAEAVYLVAVGQGSPSHRAPRVS